MRLKTTLQTNRIYSILKKSNKNNENALPNKKLFSYEDVTYDYSRRVRKNRNFDYRYFHIWLLNLSEEITTLVLKYCDLANEIAVTLKSNVQFESIFGSVNFRENSAKKVHVLSESPSTA